MNLEQQLEPYKTKYPQELLDDFLNYWTESNGKKQRWECERFFEISKRLATWLKRSNGLYDNNILSKKRTFLDTSEQLKECWISWMKYKELRGQKLVGEAIFEGIENLRKLSNDRPNVAILIIKQSLQNGWATLHIPKELPSNIDLNVPKR